MKNRFKNILVDLDFKGTKIIPFDKFLIEARSLGIWMAQEDWDTLFQLTSLPESGPPKVNYDIAIKYIIPFLTKNTDKSTSHLHEFKMSWGLSKLARLKKRQIER
mmetsp:Transcript_31767/g.48752  ORF Transcript_31767/g.48752 Transcript_31767/m.48752 type:complete len:105 (+) Transcript_31767:541-855(+)